MMFWTQVALAGLIGAAADVVLMRWAVAQGLSPKLWLQSSAAILIFAAVFALAIQRGIREGHPLSIVALVVLLTNIGFLLLWDRYAYDVALSPVQWAGFGFGVITALCFELGR